MSKSIHLYCYIKCVAVLNLTWENPCKDPLYKIIVFGAFFYLLVLLSLSIAKHVPNYYIVNVYEPPLILGKTQALHCVLHKPTGSFNSSGENPVGAL